MKIAIIGSGFTGLSAAWQLQKDRHQVHIFEANVYPGGLAAGFKQSNWDWSLEHHYHHIFATDKDIINLVHEMGLGDLLIFKSTTTSIYFNGKITQLDSPASLLSFNQLPFFSRLKTAFGLGVLRLNPFSSWMENITARDYCIKTMGKKSWEVLWRPLFQGKFGPYANQISLAWFWARIKVRSKQLGYFKGGFHRLAQEMTHTLKSNSVKFHFNTPISSINPQKNQIKITTKSQRPYLFDKVIVTTSSDIFTKITNHLPQNYLTKLSKLKNLSAQTLVLSLKKPFFTDDTYWLNINEHSFPFLAIVDHTSFMSPKNYHSEHLIYIGKYLEAKDPQLKLNKEQLLKKYHPYLDQISPGYKNHLQNSWLFSASAAQPIVTKNFSKTSLPQIKTPHENIYWASMQHIFPFDRGTNYAVKLGNEVAEMICS